ncbi:MAG: DMT family transporter [Acidobacteria bacterium]|nr:DMT family transporter [Acidobacteriota bacterium]
MTLAQAKASLTSRAFIAHLLLLAVVLVWGATFSLVKAALRDTTPLVFNLVRMTLASFVLVLANWPALKHLTRTELKLGAAAGIFLALGYQLQTTGLNHTTPSKAAFITGLVVVIVPLLSALPGARSSASEKPSIDTCIGAALAFAGLVLLTTPPGSGSALLSGIGLGEWLCLGCAIAFAAHLLTLSHAAPKVSARKLGTLQIGFAALFMLATLPLGGRPHFHSSTILWLALLITAVFATAAAFTIQSWAQQHLPASHTALIFTLEPVFAWLTALLFYGEQLSPRSLLGAGLIFTGILLAELRPTSRGKSQLLPMAGA